MSDRQVTNEMAGALARYWAGGNGPSHSAISIAFALAGYTELGDAGNKQDRVLKAIRDSDTVSASRVVEELLGLLRNSGEFERDPSYAPLQSLRSAIARAGHSLSPDGYIDWDIAAHKSITERIAVNNADWSADQPLTESQLLVLKTILDVFREKRAWPSHAYVDSIMYKRGIELNSVLASMPVGWVIPDRRSLGGVLYVQPEEELRLTILGLYRCPKAENLLALFLRAIQWAVEQLDTYQPPPTDYREPSWSFNDFLLGLQGEGSPTPPLNDAVLILELMRQEPDLPHWSGPVDNPYDWQLRIPRDIRGWRELEDIAEYVAKREESIKPRSRAVESDTVMDDRSIGDEMAKATIFIVHGRNDARKHETARVLEKLTGRDPVILHEQANRGQTIIEKFEKHARSAAFAVVLLTADDVGGLQDQQERLQARARQNVVFELGFFVGVIGRDNVVALYEPGVELPSDLHGVLYTELDPAGAWEPELARELRAAGIDVDVSGLLA